MQQSVVAADVLVFGSESRGLPARLLAEHLERRVYAPIRPGVRSPNLANVACLGVYTAVARAGVPMPSNDGTYAAHPRAAEAVRDEAALGADRVAWDLYCGTGTIALVLAGSASAVVGFELVPSAIADARANALRNGIANARFVEGDVLLGLAASQDLPAPDVLVVDPPRAGLRPRVAPALASLPARRLVYVSCNPVAAALDVAALTAGGWRLARVQPFDLFPHTPHVETVLTLERTA